LFRKQFEGTPYESLNLEYYHEAVKNWSASKNKMMIDWIATVRNWMLRDQKDKATGSGEEFNAMGTFEIKMDTAIVKAQKSKQRIQDLRDRELSMLVDRCIAETMARLGQKETLKRRAERHSERLEDDLDQWALVSAHS
jgi:hypothetical protein